MTTIAVDLGDCIPVESCNQIALATFPLSQMKTPQLAANGSRLAAHGEGQEPVSAT